MKHIIFYNEVSDFKEILEDPNIKKSVIETTRWSQHLMLGVKDDEKFFSYLALKYGDSIRTNLIKDFKPIANVDYTPIRK